MKHSFLLFRCIAVVLVTIVLLISCNSKGKLIFTSSEQALRTCQASLYEIREMKTKDIEAIASKTSEWMEIRDSAYLYIMNDTTVRKEDEIIAHFFAVLDSVKTEIERLAFASTKSMKDVVRFKILTSRNKDITTKKEYKDACWFYAEMDAVKPEEKTTDSIYRDYIKLLVSQKPFTNEKQLLQFIRQEDICFRQMIQKLPEFSQEQLQNITDKTSSLMDELYSATRNNLDNEVNKRVMIYLSMRYNRRMMQNAVKCQQDIRNRMPLHGVMAANYRWMIVQPFMSIDDYAVTLLTETQEKQLTALAEELSSLMFYIDDATASPSAKEYRKIDEVLTQYFLNTYINRIL